MKIKLAILDSDRNYLEKMGSALVRRYADKIEFYLFTDKEAALQALPFSKVDVFLVNQSFEISDDRIPGRCVYAYLSDTPGIESYRDQPIICKFQRLDMIYKQILSLYALIPNVVSGPIAADGKGKLILFCSATGGVGTSSMAAACAVRFVGKGKKVLYMNLQKFSGSELYFTGEGQRGMSDLILSLQDPDANLRIQLQSWVREDPRGVCFFGQSKMALDMMELDAESILRLISELRNFTDYDYIILDMDLSLDPSMLQVYRAVNDIVMVGDHSRECSMKTDRALEAIRILDGNSEAPLLARISLAYNRVGAQHEMDVTTPDMRVLGGVGICKVEGSRKIPDNNKVIEQLAGMGMFDKIL